MFTFSKGLTLQEFYYNYLIVQLALVNTFGKEDTILVYYSYSSRIIFAALSNLPGFDFLISSNFVTVYIFYRSFFML